MPSGAIYTVAKNEPIARDVFRMRLLGPAGAFSAPGQFVNIRIEGFYLRRPISVCRQNADGFEVIYKILGRGTARLASFGSGTELDILTGLGNGFNLAAALGPAGEPRATVLVGGGVGTPPLIGLAEALVEKGVRPQVVLGYAAAEDVFGPEEFTALGLEVFVSLESPALAPSACSPATWSPGRVTNILSGMHYDYYYACGPMGMLKAVYALAAEQSAQRGRPIEGQLSFEERMGCGFGACMGCSCETHGGAKRVCQEGPVFTSAEVIF